MTPEIFEKTFRLIQERIDSKSKIHSNVLNMHSSSFYNSFTKYMIESFANGFHFTDIQKKEGGHKLFEFFKTYLYMNLIIHKKKSFKTHDHFYQ